jgi:putative aminopeptidase FrvX
LLLWPAALAGDSIRLEFQTIAPEVIQQRLESVPNKLADRKARLIALFEGVGCQVTEQRVPQSSKAGNLVCTLPGESENAIVVGGHYDFVARGTGAVDDWSGAVLLPSLYESLKAHPRRHRFVFVAFAAEEEGLYGSKEYVKKLPREEAASIRAMINLECLGMTPPQVWASRADKQLLAAYAAVARTMGIEPQGSNVDKVGDDDSHPFLNAKIPVMTIHSVTNDTIGILHSSRDQPSAIHPADYYAAYRLATSVLALIDQKLP